MHDTDTRAAAATLQAMVREIATQHNLLVHIEWRADALEACAVTLAAPHAPRDGLMLRLVDLCEWRDQGTLHARLRPYLTLLGADAVAA